MWVSTWPIGREGVELETHNYPQTPFPRLVIITPLKQDSSSFDPRGPLKDLDVR